MSRFLITGATGLLGRCVINQLLEKGFQVVATSRSIENRYDNSLKRLSAVAGDLTDNRFVEQQVDNADIIIHCAAKTTNWGTAAEFERANVLTTKNLVKACQRSKLKRLLHVSSLAVYGHPKPSGSLVTENDPVGQSLFSFDRYVASKIASEHVVRQLGDQATIVRPTWFIGPGDQVFVPSLVRKLRSNGVWLLGSGDHPLNGLAVEDVARGVVAAATSDDCRGETLNLCSSGDLTQKAFLDIVCEHHGLPKVRRKIPLRVASAYASIIEHSARLMRRKSKPPVTRHDLTVFSRPPIFSHSKAYDLIGWKPLVPLGESLRQTLAYEDYMPGGVLEPQLQRDDWR